MTRNSPSHFVHLNSDAVVCCYDSVCSVWFCLVWFDSGRSHVSRVFVVHWLNNERILEKRQHLFLHLYVFLLLLFLSPHLIHSLKMFWFCTPWTIMVMLHPCRLFEQPGERESERKTTTHEATHEVTHLFVFFFFTSASKRDQQVVSDTVCSIVASERDVFEPLLRVSFLLGTCFPYSSICTDNFAPHAAFAWYTLLYIWF